MKIFAVFVFSLIFGLVVIERSDAQVVFDFASEYSATNNTESSIWSYRAQTDGAGNNRDMDGDYELLDAFQDSELGNVQELQGWFLADNFISLQGDFDVDGNVDSVDLGIWETGYGTSTGATKSDGNANPTHDGDVDGFDFLTWQLDFGDINGSPPYVGFNPTDHTAGVGVGPGESTLHPGAGQIVVVSWLAPGDGDVSIFYEVSDQNPAGGDGIAFSVNHVDFATGSKAFAVLNNGDDPISDTIDSFEVLAGERVNFVVDPRGTGAFSHAFDNTKLTAEVTFTAASIGATAQIPEPSAIMLACSALGMLLCYRR